MILDINMETFEEMLPLEKVRAFYVEDEEKFTLIQGVDGMLLRTVVDKEILYQNQVAQMEDNAAQTAQAAGLNVEEPVSLPPEEEIRSMAIENFRQNHLNGMRRAESISQPEIIMRF